MGAYEGSAAQAALVDRRHRVKSFAGPGDTDESTNRSTVQLRLRLTPDEDRRFREAAADRGLSLSDYARFLMSLRGAARTPAPAAPLWLSAEPPPEDHEWLLAYEADAEPASRWGVAIRADRDRLAGWLDRILAESRSRGIVWPFRTAPGSSEWYDARLETARERTHRIYREAVAGLTQEQLDAIHEVGVGGLKGCEPGAGEGVV